MKLTFKKILCLIMCAAMLVCALPLTVLAKDKNPLVPDNSMSSILSDSVMSDMVDDFFSFGSDEIIEAKIDDLAGLIKNMKSMSTLLTGISYISYTTTIVNNMMSILKTLGLMEDPQLETLESILDTVKSIKQTVDEISTKISQIQMTLDREFANTEYKIDRTAAAQLQKNWSDFINGKYEPLVDMISSYQEKNNQLSIAWCETWKTDKKTDLRALYSADGVLLFSGSNYKGFDQPLPVAPGSSDDADVENDAFETAVAFDIVIPASCLTVDPKTTVRAENYLSLITDAVTDAVSKAYENGDFTVNTAELPLWENAGITTKETIIEKVADDIVNSIFYEISSEIATSSFENTTFANGALNAYKSFCASVNGSNGIGSAIDDVYEYLSLNFAFEGEAKDYATDYYLLVGTSTVQFGAFASTLVAMSPSISKSSKEALSDLAAATMKKNNESYKGFITGHDNFCYPIGKVLSFVDVNVQSIAKCHLNYGVYEHKDGIFRHVSYSGWSVVDSSVSLDMTNLEIYRLEAEKNERQLKKSMLDTRSIEYLNHYIKASSGTGFYEYLAKNGVVDSADGHSNLVITSDYEVKNQSFDSRELKSLAFGGTEDNPAKDKYRTDRYVKLIKDGDLEYLVCDNLSGTSYTVDEAGGLKLRSDPTVAVRVLAHDDYSETEPNYLLYDDTATVTVSLTEAPVDRSTNYTREDPAHKHEYTAVETRACGAFVAEYDSNVDPYSYDVTISTKDELISFLRNVGFGNTYKGKHIILKNDIDMESVDPESYWSSSDRKNSFEGHFNGNGKTISNFTFSSSGHRVGLFRTAGNGALIENLNFSNVNISATANMDAYAALVGYATGSYLTVKNVQIISGSISGYNYVAGIVGEAYDNTAINIINCVNNASVTSKNTEAAGIAGNVGSFYIYGCVNNGVITAGNGAAGGMVGYIGNEFPDETSYAAGCRNTGSVTGYYCAGGICGRIYSNSKYSRFIGNENRGSVTVVAKGSAGGIVGWTEGGGTYINNINSGAVECKATDKIHAAGGILGGNYKLSIQFEGNRNSGRITGNDRVGGIAGYLGYKGSDDDPADKIVLIHSNSNSGRVVSSGGDAGGIVGAVSTDHPQHEIFFNTNSGSITGKKSTGGIIGWMAGGGLFDSNTNRENVTSTSGDAGGIVGVVEDDKCEFKNSRVGSPYVCKGSAPSRMLDDYDYIIRSENTSKHSGKICGWDGKRKATVNSDTLIASIFGNGNVIVIAVLSVLLIAAAVIFAVVYKKRKKVKNAVGK